MMIFVARRMALACAIALSLGSILNQAHAAAKWETVTCPATVEGNPPRVEDISSMRLKATFHEAYRYAGTGKVHCAYGRNEVPVLRALYSQNGPAQCPTTAAVSVPASGFSTKSWQYGFKKTRANDGEIQCMYQASSGEFLESEQAYSECKPAKDKSISCLPR